MIVKEDGTSDLATTARMLRNNSTDEIVQIVERSGTSGYRVEVYREIMRYYSNNRDKYGNEIFRRVMVLNTARSRVVEPELVNGGVRAYVKGLFRDAYYK